MLVGVARRYARVAEEPGLQAGPTWHRRAYPLAVVPVWHRPGPDKDRLRISPGGTVQAAGPAAVDRRRLSPMRRERGRPMRRTQGRTLNAALGLASK